MNPSLILLTLALGATSFLAHASTVDIPQWRGPNRDGVFPATGLLQQWPADGPKLAWKTEKLGKGMAGVSISGGKIFTTAGRKGGQFLVALDLATRAELWAAKISEKGGEPRCTPTIDGDLAFAVSANGDLAAVQTATGAIVWTKNYAADFDGAKTPTWQFSESPLVDGSNLIVVPGSRDAIMVALDKKTGAVVWKCAHDLPGKGHGGAGYTGAVVSQAAGIRQYITLVGKGAIGVDAKSGKLLWHYNRVANGTAVIPTPLVWDDHVFVSSGYGTGAALLRITPDQPDNATAETPKVDEAKVAELNGKLTKLNAELAARREARSKFTRGTADYEAANKLVQSIKPDLEKTESELRAAKGERGGAAPTKIAGSPVTVNEVYWLNAGVFQNHHGGMLRIGDYIYAGKGHNNGFPICL
ncbi:MAG TPA: PQQ-binding-like beta-propeller repeat protein, partial [Verrucomicrobiae bacterium]|nr:PQQ-binding-like beta-propeller repeat protein [Verrucomicrobiae bacterium]